MIIRPGKTITPNPGEQPVQFYRTTKGNVVGVPRQVSIKGYTVYYLGEQGSLKIKQLSAKPKVGVTMIPYPEYRQLAELVDLWLRERKKELVVMNVLHPDERWKRCPGNAQYWRDNPGAREAYELRQQQAELRLDELLNELAEGQDYTPTT